MGCRRNPSAESAGASRESPTSSLSEQSSQFGSKPKKQDESNHQEYTARDQENPPLSRIAIHAGIVEADVQGLTISVEEELSVGQPRVAEGQAKRGGTERKEGRDRVGDDLLAGSMWIHGGS
jgi:hypothetical protein